MTQDETNPASEEAAQYRLKVGPNNPLWLIVPILTFFGVWFLMTLEAMTWLWWGIFAAGIVALYMAASVSDTKIDTAEA